MKIRDVKTTMIYTHVLPEVDAAYISFKKGPTEVTTIHLTEDIVVDLGPGEEVVGIEVLAAPSISASRRTTLRCSYRTRRPHEQAVLRFCGNHLA